MKQTWQLFTGMLQMGDKRDTAPTPDVHAGKRASSHAGHRILHSSAGAFQGSGAMAAGGGGSSEGRHPSSPANLQPRAPLQGTPVITAPLGPHVLTAAEPNAPPSSMDNWAAGVPPGQHFSQYGSDQQQQFSHRGSHSSVTFDAVTERTGSPITLAAAPQRPHLPVFPTQSGKSSPLFGSSPDSFTATPAWMNARGLYATAAAPSGSLVSMGLPPYQPPNFPLLMQSYGQAAAAAQSLGNHGQHDGQGGCSGLLEPWLEPQAYLLKSGPSSAVTQHSDLAQHMGAESLTASRQSLMATAQGYNSASSPDTSHAGSRHMGGHVRFGAGGLPIGSWEQGLIAQAVSNSSWLASSPPSHIPSTPFAPTPPPLLDSPASQKQANTAYQQGSRFSGGSTGQSSVRDDPLTAAQLTLRRLSRCTAGQVASPASALLQPPGLHSGGSYLGLSATAETDPDPVASCQLPVRPSTFAAVLANRMLEEQDVAQLLQPPLADQLNPTQTGKCDELMLTFGPRSGSSDLLTTLTLSEDNEIMRLLTFAPASNDTPPSTSASLRSSRPGGGQGRNPSITTSRATSSRGDAATAISLTSLQLPSDFPSQQGAASCRATEGAQPILTLTPHPMPAPVPRSHVLTQDQVTLAVQQAPGNAAPPPRLLPYPLSTDPALYPQGFSEQVASLGSRLVFNEQPLSPGADRHASERSVSPAVGPRSRNTSLHRRATMAAAAVAFARTSADHVNGNGSAAPPVAANRDQLPVGTPLPVHLPGLLNQDGSRKEGAQGFPTRPVALAGVREWRECGSGGSASAVGVQSVPHIDASTDYDSPLASMGTSQLLNARHLRSLRGASTESSTHGAGQSEASLQSTLAPCLDSGGATLVGDTPPLQQQQQQQHWQQQWQQMQYLIQMQHQQQPQRQQQLDTQDQQPAQQQRQHQQEQEQQRQQKQFQQQQQQQHPALQQEGLQDASHWHQLGPSLPATTHTSPSQSGDRGGGTLQLGGLGFGYMPMLPGHGPHGLGGRPRLSMENPSGHTSQQYSGQFSGQSTVVEGNSSLPAEQLYVQSNADDLSLRALSEYLHMLGQGPEDKYVFVARQRLSLACCAFLASWLSWVKGVRAITLSHTGITDEGAVELAIGLKQSYGDLWALDLRHNNIGDEGASALADCLYNCGAMRELVLSHNRIGDAGVLALARSLGPQHRVRISHNLASAEAIRELQAHRSRRSRRASRRTLPAEPAPTTGAQHSQHRPLGLTTVISGLEAQQGMVPDRTSPASNHPGSRSGRTRRTADGRIGGAPGLPEGGQAVRLRQGLEADQRDLSQKGAKAQGELQRPDSLDLLDLMLATTDEEGAETNSKDTGRQTRGPKPIRLPGTISHGQLFLSKSECTGFGGRRGSFGPCDPHLTWAQQAERPAGEVPGMQAGAFNHLVPMQPMRLMQGFPEELQRTCALVRVLLAPTKSIEHRVAGDVGGCLLALPCSSPTPTSPIYRPSLLSSPSPPGTPVSLTASTVIPILPAPNPPSVSFIGGQSQAGNSPIGNSTLLEALAAALMAKGHVAVPSVSAGGASFVSTDSCMQNLRHQYVSVFVAQTEGEAGEESVAGVDNKLQLPRLSSSGLPIEYGYQVNQEGPDCGAVVTPLQSNHQPSIPSQCRDPSFVSLIRQSLTQAKPTSEMVPMEPSFQRLSTPGPIVLGPTEQLSGRISGKMTAASVGINGPRHRSITASSSYPNTVRIIVDPTFKDQFEIGKHSTARYNAVLAALPRVYVGQDDRMPLLVEVLCDEMAAAFKEQGVPVPPWRKPSSLISKWKQTSSVVSVGSAVVQQQPQMQHSACLLAQ